MQRFQSDDPPFLLVGTEVSAKFKGAFCEAKVKKIVKSVKCKVLLKEAPFGSVTVEDTNIRGKLELNQLVEITQGKSVHKGVIQYIKDCSTYTVVFNDGDERVLRRTQVCLKGARHFDEAVNLDSMPLYHPESFASSISSRDMRKRALKRKAAPSNMSDEEEDDDDLNVYERSSRSSRRSSSIMKTLPTVKASPSLLSLRASVRRSASVTPVKSGLAVRSSSRMAVLKASNNDDLSESPTPTPRSVQPSPTPAGPSRAGSVANSAKRVIHREQSTEKSPTASESSDDERRGDVNRSSTRSSDKAKAGTDKNGSVVSLPECTSKSSCAATSSDATLGVAPAFASSTSSVGGQPNSSAVVGRRKDRNAAESSSGPVADGGTQAHKLAQLSASTSRLMASTIASREKAVKPTDRSSSHRDLSKSSSTTLIPSASSLKQKETKKEKSKQHSTKKPSSISHKPATSSSHEPVDNAEDSDDGAAVKKYPPGSVVVINEFGPPKVGGRIHLGMVVSIKEYKTNAANVNKMPQPQNVGKRQIPVRSFQNGRYHAPYVDHLSAFNPVEFRKLTDASLPCVKIAFERANLYYTKKELPQSWEKRQSDTPSLKKESTDGRDGKDKKKHKPAKDKPKGKEDKRKRSVNSSSEDEKPKTNADDEEGSGSSEESSSDEEEDEDYNERRDRFVAHFYKFQDESGNPMNRVPVLGGREIDLYRFYDVVNRMGGHKRVTMESRWRRVLAKLRLEDCSGATPQTVKNAYLRYFEKFEFFMKHLGYSSLNDTGSSSRSSRTIRTTHESDWKKNAEKRKEKRAKEKTDGKSQQRASSKDSSVDAPSLPKVTRLATPTATTGGEKPAPSALAAAADKAVAVKTEVKTEVKLEKPVNKSVESENSTGSTPTSSAVPLKDKESTKEKESTPLDSKPAKVSAPQQQQQHIPKTSHTGTKPTSSVAIAERKPSTSSLPKVPTTTTDNGSGGELPKKPPKRMPSPSPTDAKAPKIRKESHECEKSDSKSGPIMRTKSADLTGSSTAATLTKKLKHMKPLSLKKSSKEMTSSDEDLMKLFRKRRGSAGKEGRVKSPSGHQAVEDQDVGYSNANIFTRFYQGQKVHARHHLRFYDARIVIVKQPSLADIAKSLVNAFEVGRLTHTSSPRDLNTLNLDNMGAEVKDALKNTVNATKCFVHYLGWNSRYDEWLMLHKIRVDEKDEKASTKALDALIPNELPPQLFVVAMDWCLSADGIPSLATTHAYTSDQQRPRRLSSSGATRTSLGGGSSGAKPSAAGEASMSTAAAGSEFRPSKYAVSHHRHGHHTSGSANSAVGTKSASSSGSGTGKPFVSNNPTVVASLIGASSSASSSHFGYQSPLHASAAASRSPSSSSSAGNLLMVSTSAAASSAAQPSTTPKAMDSGHSSPLSPVLHHQRLLAYQQFHHHQSASVTSTHGSYSFDESATTRQRSTTESGKFTIPHLQKGGDNQLSRTSSSSSIERASTASTAGRSDHAVEGNVSFSAFSPPLSTTTPAESIDGASNLLAPPPTVFSGAAPIGIQFYQSAPSSQSAGQHPSPTMLILTPPPPMPSTLSADKTGAGLVSMFGDSSSAVGPSNVLPRSSSTVNYFVGAHADVNTVGNSLNVHVTLAKSEESTHTTAIYPCTSTLMSSHTITHDGICSEEHCVAVVKEAAVGRRRIFSEPGRGPDELVVHTSVTATSSSSAGEAATSALLLAAVSSVMGGRSSPLTTVSSCGAVEDFDENSSIRHTETPVLNDDDECASIASVDGGGGKSAASKHFLHSPVPLKRRSGAFARGRSSRHHSKSPSGGVDTIAVEPTTATVGGRPMRRRMPSSKSPESSGIEDNYEEQITHTDTSHAVRLRVQQRMEAEHLFASYSFIGQPELEDLVHESTSCEDSIKVMDDRMELLREIYQTFRGKLTRLERRHKRAMAKRKQQVRDARERGVDDSTGRNRSPQPAVDVELSCGSQGDASKFVDNKTKAEAVTA